MLKTVNNSVLWEADFRAINITARRFSFASSTGLRDPLRRGVRSAYGNYPACGSADLLKHFAAHFRLPVGKCDLLSEKLVRKPEFAPGPSQSQ
jgi:hypothetical protein